MVIRSGFRVSGKLEDSEIGRLVIDRRLVSPDELRSVDEERRRLQQDGRHRPLGDLLVDSGFLTRTQLSRLYGEPDESSARTGQQIPGYQILNKVGAGAMATVYRARQLSLNRIVAIKVLPRRMSENPEFVDRFYKEGRAAAQLNHNNIVQAIDVGEAGGFHYFVMEYVEGCTVYDELASGKLFVEKEAISIVTQIARALQHAHEKGFIHRDVKPKNIMLTRESVAKLADMGLAREMTDHEAAMAEAGRAYGTPYYISPEQIRGQVLIDHRADIYSLGATFYHMITGRVPFEGPTPSAVMHKHLKESLTPPDHLNTHLTAGCGTMIEKMMAKDAEDRYATAADLLTDLDLLARGQRLKFAPLRLDHGMLETLAEGEEHHHEAPPPPSNGAPPIALTVTLGALLFVSVLVNVILLANR
ncbi:MAG: Serine/threonine-protein kinase PknD [Phycisphaerae bacterium]|nr:Serine/threonine-protein kinase PknD [Phycisphaerae bacterium]